MLADSARIQEEDAAVASVVQRRRPTPGVQPLYTRSDADARSTAVRRRPLRRRRATSARRPAALHRRRPHPRLGDGRADASHGGRDHRITFTGDLGRRGLPFLREPSPVPAGRPAHLRKHLRRPASTTPSSGMAAKMGDVVRRTAGARRQGADPRLQPGPHADRRPLPAAAGCATGVLPRLPIYVDSPLAADIAEVYDGYPATFAGRRRRRRAAGGRTSRTARGEQGAGRQPRAVHRRRLRRHVRGRPDHAAPPPPHRRPAQHASCWSATRPGHAGAQLLEKGPTGASTAATGTSGPRWSSSTASPATPTRTISWPSWRRWRGRRQVCLVHGEGERAEALAEGLRGAGFPDVILPEVGASVGLSG